jgi:hypothetical protein
MVLPVRASVNSFDADPEEVEAIAKVVYEYWLRRFWQPRLWKNCHHKGSARLVAYLALATIAKIRNARIEGRNLNDDEVGFLPYSAQNDGEPSR